MLTLFRNGPTLAKLSLILALQAAPDYLGTVQIAYAKEYDWTASQYGRFAMFAGLTSMVLKKNKIKQNKKSKRKTKKTNVSPKGEETLKRGEKKSKGVSQEVAGGRGGCSFYQYINYKNKKKKFA